MREKDCPLKTDLCLEETSRMHAQRKVYHFVKHPKKGQRDLDLEELSSVSCWSDTKLDLVIFT